MKTDEMLKAIIEKAEKNGWKNNLGNPDWNYTERNRDIDFQMLIEDKSYSYILFSHDFAKAFWRDEEEDYILYESYSSAHENRKFKIYKRGWQFHIQQAVISDNPIKYYYDNL